VEKESGIRTTLDDPGHLGKGYHIYCIFCLPQVSSTASTDEVGPSTSSMVVVPTNSVPSLCFPVHCFCGRDKKHVYFVNNITNPKEVEGN